MDGRLRIGKISLLLSFVLFSCSRTETSQLTDTIPQEPMEFRDVALVDSNVQRIYFHNFSPAESDARTGLDYILQGKVFSPNGVPLQVLEKAAQHRPKDGDIPSPSPKSPRDQYMIFGNLPSPESRKLGVTSTYDPGLSNSVVDIAFCEDLSDGSEKATALPKDKNNPVGDCRASFWTGKAELSRTVTTNCLGCHSGVSAGILSAGLGNSSLDQVAIGAEFAMLQDTIDSNAPGARDRFIGLPNPTGVKRIIARWFMGLNLNNTEKEILENHFNFSETVMLPVFNSAHSRGDNLGPNWVWKYFARLKIGSSANATLETFNRYQKAPIDDELFKKGNVVLPTVDPQPWWNMRYKNTVYWYGETNRIAKDFAFNFTQAHRGLDLNHKAHVRYVEKALQFARSTTPPAYPKEINFTKVEEGRRLFHEKQIVTQHGTATCSSCHGTYENLTPGKAHWRVNYPGPNTKPMNFIDPLYMDVTKRFGTRLKPQLDMLQLKFGRDFGQIYLEDYLPAFDAMPPEGGVLPPPLVGIWASAPYFHNGSVPTLFEVLRPQRRSTAWSRVLDPLAYDFKKVGLSYDESMMFDELYAQNRPLPSAKELRSPNHDEMKKYSDKHYYDLKSVDFRRTYYTDMPGKNVSGHTFAAEWSDDEIYTVIEFLKSLSGKNIAPLKESDFRTIRLEN